MTPITFPKCNATFGPPEGLDESQVRPVRVYVHVVHGGSCDGLQQIVVGYQPSAEDIERIKNGALVYLSVIGGLPPHYLSTDLHSATHPS